MTQPQIRPSIIQHRRETWLWLVLPMALLLLLIAAAVVVAAVFPRRLQGAQVGMVADVMLSIIVLCPLALCMLPVTILAVGAVVGMNRAHQAVARPLYRVQDRSTAVTKKVGSIAERINRAAIDVSARFGFIYKLLGTFEEHADEDSKPHEQ